MIRKKRSLTVETSVIEVAGAAVFTHRIRGFKRKLDKETAELFTRFYELLARPGERVLVSFYPLFQEDWMHICASNWTTITSVPEQRSSKRKIEQLGWVLGYAHTKEKMAEVYRFGWNKNLNDTLLVVIAPQRDDGSFLISRRADIGPGDELIAIERYHTAAGCYFNARWITVASKIYGVGEIVEKLLNAASEGYSVSAQIRMEREKGTR